MTDAKFKLEDILNKKKAPPQILDLANIKIESEEDFKAVIEKIPDYRIKPERPEETLEQMEVLCESMRQYKRHRRQRRSEYVRQLDENTTSRQRKPSGGEQSSRAQTPTTPDRSPYKPEDTRADMNPKTQAAWKGLVMKQRLKDMFERDKKEKENEEDVNKPKGVKFQEDEQKRDEQPNQVFPEDNAASSSNRQRGAHCKKSSLFFPQPPYQFADPCPASMRGVKISDLSSVDINWKMLTLARPTNKTDEEIFSKLVYLDKLRLQTRSREAEQSLARGGKDPFIVVKNPSASKGGVAETSIKTCIECGEEFCSGTCKEFQYDAYQRVIMADKDKDVGAAGANGGEDGDGEFGEGGKRRRKKKRRRSKRKHSKRRSNRALAQEQPSQRDNNNDGDE